MTVFVVSALVSVLIILVVADQHNHHYENIKKAALEYEIARLQQEEGDCHAMSETAYMRGQNEKAKRLADRARQLRTELRTLQTKC